MTTSLSRGISSVRFLRLCSRAPPIRMKLLLMSANFQNQTIGKRRAAARMRKGKKRFAGRIKGAFAKLEPSIEHRSTAVTNWVALGSVTEVSPGQFQFTDRQTTNSHQRFYRVRTD